MIKVDKDRQVAIILHPKSLGAGSENAAYELEEAVNLSTALDVDVVDTDIISLRDIKAGTYFGKGKIDDIKARVKAYDATLIAINGAITPIQQRNLEKIWNTKVIDRTGLILEIFARRAATKEGRLQVELARQIYERSRLVRTWTHLERQRGGQGFLAGPGETQIEADRRMLATKIGRLKRDLESVRRTRGLQRAKRQRAPERIVALVGYTNAGKSSIFNHLTSGGVLAKDMLFATLDTTHRVLELPSGKPAVLSDTVGFISDLPTHLIDAFRATLEEVKEADLLIHVRDISDTLGEQRKEDVLEVLKAIEAGPEYGQNMLEVWNKSDLLSGVEKNVMAERAKAQSLLEDGQSAVLTSCIESSGLDDLRLRIEEALTENDEVLDLKIGPQDYAARAWVHQNGTVLREDTRRSGLCEMTVRLSQADIGKFRARYPKLVA